MDESTSLRGGQCRPPLVSASTAEMDQLAFEASSALDAANKATQTTIERYRDAGLVLIKAKAKCKHGDWMLWLTKHRIHPRRAAKAIRIATHFAKLDLATNLDEALAQLAKDETVPYSVGTPHPTSQEVEQPTSQSTGFFELETNVQPILCRQCRMFGSLNSCDKHKAKPVAETHQAFVPGTAREPGDDFTATGEPGGDEWMMKATRAHVALGKRVTELIQSREVHDDYKKLVEGQIAGLGGCLEVIAKSPPHVPEPPRQGSCKYCKGVVLWCETATYKRIPLDVERCRGGRYDLIANVATRIEKSDQPAYMSHFLTCPKRPQK